MRRNLAVSTVVGTVLMTTLTITLGTLVVAWSSQAFGVYQGNAGVYFTNRAAALSETFVIEDIWFYVSGSNYINITVRNTGTIDIKIVAIYVDSVSSYSISPSLGSGYRVPVGQAVTFRVTYTGSKSFTSLNTYFLQAASGRGNQANSYWTYPQ